MWPFSAKQWQDSWGPTSVDDTKSEAYCRGVAALKLVDDPQRLAVRIDQLKRVVDEDPTDRLSRMELSHLMRLLKAEQSTDNYRRLWCV